MKHWWGKTSAIVLWNNNALQDIKKWCQRKRKKRHSSKPTRPTVTHTHFSCTAALENVFLCLPFFHFPLFLVSFCILPWYLYQVCFLFLLHTLPSFLALQSVFILLAGEISSMNSFICPREWEEMELCLFSPKWTIYISREHPAWCPGLFSAWVILLTVGIRERLYSWRA